jgi:FO synthase
VNEAILTGLAHDRRAAVEKALSGDRLTRADSMALAGATSAEHPALWAAAAHMRDLTRPPIVTYSRKVFIPLTNLCRDVCSYCTFAVDEDSIRARTMSPDDVLKMAEEAKALGCKEALFCIGDRPEVRWPKYRDILKGFGHDSTQSYLVAMCRMVMEETGLLPHPNAGIMSERELRELREVSPSQGIMLESTSERLCAPGGPHEHAPDKKPRTRLAMLRRAGTLRIPFTTGILIGLGETEDERIDALLAIRDINDEYGHIQEVIVQNFRAKLETPMADAGEPGLIELMTTCAIARLVLGPDMNLQAPPNLSADYGPLLLTGINDWGGVSPVTPDFINPERPWPDLGLMAGMCQESGYPLRERLTVYPEYALDPEWVDPGVMPYVEAQATAEGYPKSDALDAVTA